MSDLLRIVDILLTQVFPITCSVCFAYWLDGRIDRKRRRLFDGLRRPRYSTMTFCVILSGLATGILFIDTELSMISLGRAFPFVMVASFCFWWFLGERCVGLDTMSPYPRSDILNVVSAAWVGAMAVWFIRASIVHSH